MALTSEQKGFIQTSIEHLFAPLEEEKPNLTHEIKQIKYCFSNVTMINEPYKTLQKIIKIPMEYLSRLEHLSGSLTTIGDVRLHILEIANNAIVKAAERLRQIISPTDWNIENIKSQMDMQNANTPFFSVRPQATEEVRPYSIPYHEERIYQGHVEANPIDDNIEVHIRFDIQENRESKSDNSLIAFVDEYDTNIITDRQQHEFLTNCVIKARHIADEKVIIKILSKLSNEKIITENEATMGSKHLNELLLLTFKPYYEAISKKEITIFEILKFTQQEREILLDNNIMKYINKKKLSIQYIKSLTPDYFAVYD